MSLKELGRASILERVRLRELSKVAAGRQLGVTRQQIGRLYKAYCQEGPKGLSSKKRGKVSNNKISSQIREAIVKIIQEQYWDFGPTLAHEKLVEIHQFKISDESVRKLMIKAGIWKGKRRKIAKVHQMRPRRPAVGELVQIDGSPHDWFEGRRMSCCLLVLVDDATTRLLGLLFVEHECLQGYFDLIRHYIERYGRPISLYSDRHSIFHPHIKEAEDGESKTQLGRALDQLDIELLPASSPQAKGRVENINGTLQDRLIKEMRLAKINDMNTANAWLPNFIEDYNRRFAVEPSCPHDAHRPYLPSAAELDQIFSIQSKRKLSKNLELSYNNVIFQIKTTSPSYNMRGAQVIVCESPQQIILLYNNKPLPYTTFDKANRPIPALSSKEINHYLDKRTLSRKPKPDHPWRNAPKTMPSLATTHLPTASIKQPDPCLSSAL